MTIAIAARQAWPFLGRLGIAFAEIVLAAAAIVGSVILGHELREWRDWYWDPSTPRLWEPTPSPSAPAAFEAPAP
jgi:hypothetical protein